MKTRTRSRPIRERLASARILAPAALVGVFFAAPTRTFAQADSDDPP